MKIQDCIMLMLMIMKEFNQNEFKMKCQVFIEQLTKLGSTPFTPNQILVDIDSNIFINIKELNELRRQAVEKLINIKEGQPKPEVHFNIPYK